MLALLLLALAVVDFKDHYDEYAFGKGNSPYSILLKILNNTESMIKWKAELSTKVDELSTKVDILLGGYGGRKSYHAACYIVGDFNGSCIVVNINGSYYAATNRHVIYDDQKNCTCIIQYITMTDNSTLIFSSNMTFFSTLAAPDLALIPLKVNSKQASNAILVSNVTCQIRDKLFGTTFQQRNIYYSECNIVEDVNDTKYISDCPGFPGYSGTGYLNYYGELIAVHYGSVQTSYERKIQINHCKREKNMAIVNTYYDCVDLANEIINFIFGSINDLVYNYSKSCNSNQDISSIFSSFNKSFGEHGFYINDTIYDLTVNLMDKLEKNIEYHARNPRTLIIPAYHLYELAHINKSSRVVSIKQGKSFNLTLA